MGLRHPAYYAYDVNVTVNVTFIRISYNMYYVHNANVKFMYMHKSATKTCHRHIKDA